MTENRTLVGSLVIVRIDEFVEPTMNHVNAEPLGGDGSAKINDTAQLRVCVLKIDKSSFYTPHRKTY